MLKEKYFLECISFCIENSIFPSDLKLDLNPAFKNKSKTLKDNYRLISVLRNISKIYERFLYNHIQTSFDKILPKYQSGFHKVFNAQHYLVSMIEKLVPL